MTTSRPAPAAQLRKVAVTMTVMARIQKSADLPVEISPNGSLMLGSAQEAASPAILAFGALLNTP